MQGCIAFHKFLIIFYINTITAAVVFALRSGSDLLTAWPAYAVLGHHHLFIRLHREGSSVNLNDKWQ